MKLKDNMKNIFVGVLIIFLYLIWPYFSNYIIGMFTNDELLVKSFTFLLNFVLLGIVLFFYADNLRSDWKKFLKNKKKNFKIGIVTLIIAIIVFGVTNGLISELFKIEESNNATSLYKFFEGFPFYLLITTILYYPIIEEVVFKMTLKNVLKSKWAFIIISGFANALFAEAIAASNTNYLIYIVPSTVFGMFFSYMYYKCDNIVLPIFMRIVYNIIFNLIFVFVSV